MKRFNSVDKIDAYNSVLNIIFNSVYKASNISLGDFRKDGLGRVNSSFFNFVFLCGGNRDEHTSREVLTKELKKNENVKIIISEDLSKFKGDLDLLTFESTLEALSKMILIPVESFGTACELGAFTRMKENNNKVVAIVNEKRKNEESFINYGPIEFLKELKDDRVYFASFKKQKGKLHLVINSGIASLHCHHLLTDSNKIFNYYKVDSNSAMTITHLFSFFVAVIDFLCLVGFADSGLILDFFKRLGNAKCINLNDDIIDCDETKLKKMINTLLNILFSLGFLEKKNDIFLTVASAFSTKDKTGDRWIGRVLFTKTFTRTDEYLFIKSQCLRIKRKIEKYGCH